VNYEICVAANAKNNPVQSHKTGFVQGCFSLREEYF
jgi:hypothetical protein